MSVLMEVFEMADGDTAITCQGCGKVIPFEDDFDTFWSQDRDDHFLADSGNYCDDCFPRCYSPNCN